MLAMTPDCDPDCCPSPGPSPSPSVTCGDCTTDLPNEINADWKIYSPGDSSCTGTLHSSGTAALTFDGGDRWVSSCFTADDGFGDRDFLIFFDRTTANCGINMERYLSTDGTCGTLQADGSDIIGNPDVCDPFEDQSACFPLQQPIFPFNTLQRVTVKTYE